MAVNGVAKGEVGGMEVKLGAKRFGRNASELRRKTSTVICLGDYIGGTIAAANLATGAMLIRHAIVSFPTTFRGKWPQSYVGGRGG